ncbi:MAG: chemotaxis protein CheX [Deltaproteobacteria bacterium]|nr:chemotaxis protein CheX [Deltaproteobacteria bacterium]
MANEESKKERIQEGIRSAVTSLFMMMIGSEPTFKGVREAAGFSLTEDVAGVMYLPGERTGMVACGVPEQLARSIVGKMTGIEKDELGEADISDGLAEVVNMLSGSIKTQCPELGFTLTPPISLFGTECCVTWKVDHPSIILDYDVEGSDFTVVACL